MSEQNGISCDSVTAPESHHVIQYVNSTYGHCSLSVADRLEIARDVCARRVQPSDIAIALAKQWSVTGSRPSRTIGLHITTPTDRIERRNDSVNAQYARTLFRLEYLRRRYASCVRQGKYKQGAKFTAMQLPLVQKLAELEHNAELNASYEN